jgi:type II secretory pathway component PulF
MASFLYRYSDMEGTVREAMREAPSEEVLLRDLANARLFPLSVRQIDAAAVGEAPIRSSPHYSMRAVRDFTTGIALMVRSGLSVRDALEVARGVFSAGAGRRGEARRLVEFLDERIQAGASLSTCLTVLDQSFPAVYRGLVQIGERVGTLDQVLTRLASYLEDQKKMRDKIIGALTYPLLVLGVAFAGMITVAAVVVPKAQELFDQVGTSLPPSVRGIGRSAAVSLTVTIVLLVVVVALVITIGFLRRRGARRIDGAARRAMVRIDELALKFPGLGSFLSVREMVNLTFALEVLTESGVAVEDALRESSRAVGNAALEEALLHAADDVVAGKPVSAALSRHGGKSTPIPPRVGHWVVIGERTGRVEQVFSQLRLYYQAEFEKWTSRIMTLVEPALIVVVGVILMFMILTFVVPLFSLYGSIIQQ